MDNCINGCPINSGDKFIKVDDIDGSAVCSDCLPHERKYLLSLIDETMMDGEIIEALENLGHVKWQIAG